jgi:ribosomal protein S18 acetylase RimI-like enzyme
VSLSIRRGAQADAPSLAEFGARAFREAFEADNTPEDMALYLSQTYGTAQQTAELLDPAITTLLVEADGGLAGFAQLRSGAIPACVEGQAPIEIWRFYVAREWHGQGVAQTLMQNVELEARRLGGKTLWLGVWERNERAKAFYRKYGFTEVGSHIFVVGTDPQTDNILVRPLLDRQG